ncbi:MAG: hypothetical protein U9N86_04110, partial [Bacteroidota bacterium]|nr:hypothetical protein [Bacteroidota bacterium]
MEKQEKIQLLSKLITGTGMFAGLIAIILLLNFLQMQKQDPIESSVIAALVERLDQEPDNEALKLEIRQLDLLARKAYFTSEWQVKTGGFILLFAGIFLGLLLKMQHDLMTKIEEPDDPNADHQAARKNSVHWIWGIGTLIFIAALGAAFSTNNQLANYDDFKLAQLKAEEQKQITPTEEIEVIDLSEPPPQLHSETENSIPESPIPESPRFDSAQRPELRIPESPIPESPIYHNAFRGPFSNGVSPAKNIPTEWDIATGKNLIWKVP